MRLPPLSRFAWMCAWFISLFIGLGIYQISFTTLAQAGTSLLILHGVLAGIFAWFISSVQYHLLSTQRRPIVGWGLLATAGGFIGGILGYSLHFYVTSLSTIGNTSFEPIMWVMFGMIVIQAGLLKVENYSRSWRWFILNTLAILLSGWLLLATPINNLSALLLMSAIMTLTTDDLLGERSNSDKQKRQLEHAQQRLSVKTEAQK